MTQTTRIALLQHACSEDVSANIAKAHGMIRDAAKQGAQVVFTPELYTSQYFCQTEDPAKFDLAVTIPGKLTDSICELAKACQINLVASLFEKRAPGLYHNTSVCIDDTGTMLNRYRKMHIPDDPGFYEKFYFTPGDPRKSCPRKSEASEVHGSSEDLSNAGYQTTQLGDLNVGTLICWDQWYPEAARLTAMLGAQILQYPTAIGYWKGEPAQEGARQRDAWITMQRSHAIANGCFVAAINRIGTEGDITFWGSSFVADPGGQIIAQASEDQEEIIIVDIDLSLMETTRRMWPFFRDRRIDTFGDLQQRWLK
ncbi:MAG TPA: acyltransferase [Phycisphaerales bacterium]|nr:acyltransferase [Phycisphaerales bacterium]|tara:strand:- start:62684 stop:63619 length:936 start_codon:yes stop_codon:yes gene_type:complete